MVFIIGNHLSNGHLTLGLMRAGCVGKTKELIASPAISENLKSAEEEDTFEPSYPYQCLVATKVLYFGVAGGVMEFLGKDRTTKRPRRDLSRNAKSVLAEN